MLERLAAPGGLAPRYLAGSAQVQDERSTCTVFRTASRADDRIARQIVEAHLARLANALGAARRLV